VIVVKLMGGMGNQLFQYAAGRALALKYQTELKIDVSFLNADPKNEYTKREFELNKFNTTFLIASPKDIATFYKKSLFDKFISAFFPNSIFKKNIFNQNDFGFMEDFFTSSSKRTYLNGYWQSEKYFNSIREILLKDLVIKKEMTEACNLMKTQIQNSNSVSLHIRRGDYVSNKNANEFHGILPLDYYHRAIAYLNEKKSNLKVYVFSDDIDWVKINLKLENTCVYIDFNTGDDSVFDMYLMSICKHNIIANSSFSWWGAWLNQNPEKIVIAPQLWFADKSLNTNDLIPSTWQKM